MTNDDIAAYNNIGMGQTREQLLAHLERESQVLMNLNIKRAFEKVDRADFVPGDYAVEAYEDYAIPIGYGGTISQPTTVAFMLELLGLDEGDSVLDIGSGSGWTTALMAEIVGEAGSVLGLEIVPELVEEGKKNLKKYTYNHAKIEASGKKLGSERKKMYDKILVSADSDTIPQELLAQLKDRGVMVIPIKNAIHKIKKIGDDIQEMRFPGFAFVPLQ